MDYSGGLNKFFCDNSILAKKNKLIFFRLAEEDNKEGNKKIVIWKVALEFLLEQNIEKWYAREFSVGGGTVPAKAPLVDRNGGTN